MQLGDVYKHKINKDIIQIDSFATRITSISNTDMIIVCANISNCGGEWGYLPSFNSYGTQEEIEGLYELFISAEDLKKYNSWEDMFEKNKI